MYDSCSLVFVDCRCIRFIISIGSLRRRHTRTEPVDGALRLNRCAAARQALTNEKSRRGRGETSHWSEPDALRQIGSVSGVLLPVLFECDEALRCGLCDDRWNGKLRAA